VLAAVIALLAAGLLVFLGTRLLDEDDEGGPVAYSERELVDQAGEFDHPVYWVGPQPAISEYELTETEDGPVYIRYLTAGKEPGDPDPEFLSVGTYPLPNAVKQMREGEAAGGQELSRQADYSLQVGANGKSAYVVFDDQPDLQIEIFDPQPGVATKLAKSAALRPLG
jgi:hypothetical protein